jgi:hypothetical protein
MADGEEEQECHCYYCKVFHFLLKLLLLAENQIILSVVKDCLFSHSIYSVNFFSKSFFVASGVALFIYFMS